MKTNVLVAENSFVTKQEIGRILLKVAAGQKREVPNTTNSLLNGAD
jgi:hypothetical protein